MKIRKSIFTFLLYAVAVLTGFNIFAAEKDQEFVVVIDAGHGGHDTGAIDNGVKEKDINLAVAKRLQEDIQKKLKGVKVILTRNNDSFVTLQGRADIANRNRADLFISIHTNSVDAKNPNRKTVAGTSVYALGLHKDKDNLNVAKRENAVIELEQNHDQKYSGFDPSKDESYIIFEMAQKKNLEQSLKFANFAQKQLVSAAGRKDRGVKQAGFWVLWATSMPAVLVELDFICNPNSAQFMGSAAGVKKMGEALCNAVEQYYNSVKANNGVGKRVALNSKNKNLSQPANQMSVVSPKQANVSATKKTVTSSSDETRAELVGQTKAKRTDTPPSINKSSSPNGRVTAARKRRSTSSKLASEKRNVSTSSIQVKSEKDYLVKSGEKRTVAKQETKVAVKESPKERKKRLALEKKNKEKERKEREALKKKEAKAKEEALKKRRKEYKQKANNKNSKMSVVTKNTTSSNQNASSKNSTSSTVQVKKRKSLNSKCK